ncbi:hypothetical protein GCM10010359_23460 [Streptomyces morookaense]|nr:hypothetical protein GCM10010359_23460 [Streptomyces morookaense]
MASCGPAGAAEAVAVRVVAVSAADTTAAARALYAVCLRIGAVLPLRSRWHVGVPVQEDTANCSWVEPGSARGTESGHGAGFRFGNSLFRWNAPKVIGWLR